MSEVEISANLERLIEDIIFRRKSMRDIDTAIDMARLHLEPFYEGSPYNERPMVMWDAVDSWYFETGYDSDVALFFGRTNVWKVDKATGITPTSITEDFEAYEEFTYADKVEVLGVFDPPKPLHIDFGDELNVGSELPQRSTQGSKRLVVKRDG